MNRRDAVLTIDVGLTNCKVSVFDTAGQLISSDSRPYPTYSPRIGWSEQHPKDWWKALVTGVHALHDASVFDTVEVQAIVVTAHMHALLALDSDLQPITTCWTLFDRRALAEAETLRSDDVYERTGARLEPYTPAAKIAWLKHNQQSVFNQAELFVSPKDAIRILLGGDPVTDPIDAAGTLLYDIHERDWYSDVLHTIGIHRSQLPEVRDSTSQAGSLSKDAAQTLGLTAGIPLIVGAGDDIEALGAGIFEAGQTLEHIGTTGTVISCIRHPIPDPERRIESYPHAIPGRFLFGGATNAAGKSLDWAKTVLEPGTNLADLPLTYSRDGNAPEAPVYLPYISGERGLLWDANATGALLGLRDSHTAHDIAYSVYEGVALSMKEIIYANMQLGVGVVEVISGTPDSNRSWSQLRADVYGLPIAFPDSKNLTGLGSTLLALVGLGMFEGIQDVVSRCCTISHRVVPDPDRTIHFERRFDLYQQAVDTYRSLLVQV